jgi:hypothetical protein
VPVTGRILAAFGLALAALGPLGAAPAGATAADLAGSDPTVPARVADVASTGQAGPGTGGPTLALADQTTWLEPPQAFEAQVRVGAAPVDAGLRVTVHDALRSRGDFRASLDGELGGVEHDEPARPLAGLQISDGGLATVGFGAEVDLDQGVHPVEIELVDAGGEPLATVVTHVIVVPSSTEGYAPLSVAVVLDIAGPPALQPDGSVLLGSDVLDRVEERVTTLGQAPDVPITLAPRPETLDALGLVGARGLELVGDFVDARGDRPVVARPYTDVDIGALMEADLIGEANAQADGGADVIRTVMGTEPVGGIWLTRGPLGPDAARMLNELGVGRAVVEPGAVAEAPGLREGRVPEEPVTLGDGGPVAMVDDALLGERLTGDEPVLDAQRFVAELAMAWLEAPAITRGVVVRVPAEVPLDPDLVTRALGQLTQRDAVRLVTLPQLFDMVPPTEGDAPPVAEPADPGDGGGLGSIAARLRRARETVGGIGGVLGDAETGRSLENSLLLATGADTPSDQRAAYVDRVTGELRNLAGLIDAPDEFRITLTSRTASVPLNLTNESTEPVDVLIRFESDQLEFPDGEEILTTLEPGANPLQVRVRVLASGAFPLDIEITSPDGSIRLDSTRFDIRSTAVSGVGVILSVGAGLFLAVWWIRNWRATTRSKKLVPPGSRPEDLTPAGGAPVLPPDGPAPPLPVQPWEPGPPGQPGRPEPPPPSGAPVPPAPGRRGNHRPAHMASPRRNR